VGQQTRVALEETVIKKLVVILTPIPRVVNYPNLMQSFPYWHRMYQRAKKRYNVLFIFAVQVGTNAMPTIDSLHVPKKILWVEYQNENRFVEIAYSRNLLLKEARALKAKYTIFLDSDIGAPAATIDRLIADGKDFVGALAVTYRNDQKPMLGFGVFREPFYTGCEWAGEIPEKKLTQVGFMCSICICLSERILNDLRLWFPMNLDLMGRKIAEDHAFSKLLTECDYELWVDSTLHVLHFRGETILGIEPPEGFTGPQMEWNSKLLDFKPIGVGV